MVSLSRKSPCSAGARIHKESPDIAGGAHANSEDFDTEADDQRIMFEYACDKNATRTAPRTLDSKRLNCEFGAVWSHQQAEADYWYREVASCTSTEMILTLALETGRPVMRLKRQASDALQNHTFDEQKRKNGNLWCLRPDETKRAVSMKRPRVSRTRRTHVRGRDWPTRARIGSLTGATRRPDMRERFRRALMGHALRENVVFFGAFVLILAQRCDRTLAATHLDDVSLASEPGAEHIMHVVLNLLIFGTWELSWCLDQACH